MVTEPLSGRKRDQGAHLSNHQNNILDDVAGSGFDLPAGKLGGSSDQGRRRLEERVRARMKAVGVSRGPRVSEISTNLKTRLYLCLCLVTESYSISTEGGDKEVCEAV